MDKLTYFKIGLFVISATIIGVIGIVVLGVGTLLQKKNIVETYIDESVQGLDVGSAVKFRGVAVGKVEDITLTSVVYATRRRYVLVRVGLASNMFQFPLADAGSPGFEAEIAKGLRVRLAAQGLTGTAYIEADYVDPARNPPLEIDWQPAYPYVPSTQSRITQLSEAVDRILRNIEDVNLPRLTQGIEKSLSTITRLAESIKLESINAQTNALLTEVRETNKQLKELASGPELKAIVQDGSAVAARARQVIERIDKPLTQFVADLPKATANLNRLIERVDSASADIPETGAQLKQALQRLNRLLSAQRPEIEQTVENLRAISENMKELTDSSKRYPSQVLFGAPPPPSKVMER
jgi:phospholipid/cholesterol/gamma-HCH transport system substrate-binding protein/paraquat-inducible protein B